MTPDEYFPPLSPMQTGLAAKCPRCGRGELFHGYLTIRPQCDRCGLDYSAADAGDGPAVFVIFITGFVSVVFAFILRFGFDAPPWAVLLMTLILLGGLTFMLLRPMKGVMVALQYRNKAAEGRLS